MRSYLATRSRAAMRSRRESSIPAAGPQATLPGSGRAKYSLALQDFDCTTEGRELNLGVTVVDRSEKALGHLVLGRAHIVAVGNDGRLIDDVAVEGGRADVERV